MLDTKLSSETAGYLIFGSVVSVCALVSYTGSASARHAEALKQASALLNEEDEPSRAERASIRRKYSPKLFPVRDSTREDGQSLESSVEYDTIIIGSGMAGLSCAAIISRLGKKVLVLEQHNDVAGGGTHQFDIGGYRFGSGLHYTVPWSVPVFALTCLKTESQVCQFKLMGDAANTVDKVHLHELGKDDDRIAKPFNMKLFEEHMKDLYGEFPDEHSALDEFIRVSDQAMLMVKIFLFARLLPQWMQRLYWRYLVPSDLLKVASQTAEQILPQLTTNKRLISLLSSMWIDTGARPDRATFMMTAAVFRGVAMEGGCYPAKGAEAMAIELVRTIEENHGTVLIRAEVEEILTEPICEAASSATARVCGVRVRSSNSTSKGDAGSTRRTILCKRVVSSAGYANTFQKLLPAEVVQGAGIPAKLPVPQSDGFVMANIGISGITPEEADIGNCNSWHIPIDGTGDGFAPMRDYFHNPLKSPTVDSGSGSEAEQPHLHLRIPAFIAFPSIRDVAWSKTHPGKICCQILMMAKYDWFSDIFGDSGLVIPPSVPTGAYSADGRVQAKYEEAKELWRRRSVDLLCHYFPKLRGKIELADISTPLTIEKYLRTAHGGAVGIDVTPQRCVDPEVRQRLDCVVPEINGLYMTGQDVALCGVTLCQIAGVITAFRMEGLRAALSILWQSIWLGLTQK